ncbi:hypothetical protein CHK_1546 [Christensenella hongkongensis]|uniref:Uncharacterized protein n=1 Tax=Christensenella hongkongensis TaxID=270498 RepID=A0A0M2NF53_9FIRM|nr:hypothetical protein CHK_1546 [Christensenella hongkongensis]
MFLSFEEHAFPKMFFYSSVSPAVFFYFIISAAKLLSRASKTVCSGTVAIPVQTW